MWVGRIGTVIPSVQHCPQILACDSGQEPVGCSTWAQRGKHHGPPHLNFFQCFQWYGFSSEGHPTSWHCIYTDINGHDSTGGIVAECSIDENGGQGWNAAGLHGVQHTRYHTKRCLAAWVSGGVVGREHPYIHTTCSPCQGPRLMPAVCLLYHSPPPTVQPAFHPDCHSRTTLFPFLLRPPPTHCHTYSKPRPQRHALPHAPRVHKIAPSLLTSQPRIQHLTRRI